MNKQKRKFKDTDLPDSTNKEPSLKKQKQDRNEENLSRRRIFQDVSPTPETVKKLKNLKFKTSTDHILRRGDTPAYVIRGHPLFYMFNKNVSATAMSVDSITKEIMSMSVDCSEQNVGISSEKKYFSDVQSEYIPSDEEKRDLSAEFHRIVVSDSTSPTPYYVSQPYHVKEHRIQCDDAVKVECEVNKIIDCNIFADGKICYSVEWKNKIDGASWFPLKDLNNARDVVDDFITKHRHALRKKYRIVTEQNVGKNGAKKHLKLKKKMKRKNKKRKTREYYNRRKQAKRKKRNIR